MPANRAQGVATIADSQYISVRVAGVQLLAEQAGPDRHREHHHIAGAEAGDAQGQGQAAALAVLGRSRPRPDRTGPRIAQVVQRRDRRAPDRRRRRRRSRELAGGQVQPRLADPRQGARRRVSILAMQAGAARAAAPAVPAAILARGSPRRRNAARSASSDGHGSAMQRRSAVAPVAAARRRPSRRGPRRRAARRRPRGRSPGAALREAQRAVRRSRSPGAQRRPSTVRPTSGAPALSSTARRSPRPCARAVAPAVDPPAQRACCARLARERAVVGQAVLVGRHRALAGEGPVGRSTMKPMLTAMSTPKKTSRRPDVPALEHGTGAGFGRLIAGSRPRTGTPSASAATLARAQDLEG